MALRKHRISFDSRVLWIQNDGKPLGMIQLFMRIVNRRSTLAGYILLLLFSVSSSTAQTGILPTPTGSLGVGRLVLHWRDDSRPEVLSQRDRDKREIAVWFWYPAMDLKERQKAPYIDELDALAQSLSSDEVSLARSVETHAVTDAPLVSSPTRLP